MGLIRWFRQRPTDDEMREELEAHVTMRAAHDGVDEAAARRRLGNTLRTREAMRRIWIAEWWDALSQDATFTVRSWRRQPGFALGAVLVLALGLGASTALFSALDRILFRPLQYGDADRLVNVGRTFPGVERPDQSRALLPAGEYLERWKPAPAPFTAVTTSSAAGDTCDVTEQHPERLRCASVESNFLQTLGVPVALGRDFTSEDDVRNAAPVAIISHDVWIRRFGADSGAIGRTIDLDGKRTRVIGVLPAGFAVPGGQSDILRPQQQRDGFEGALLAAFARLKPGVTPEQAEAAIAPIIEAAANGSGGIRPASQPGREAQARVVPLRDYLVGDTSRVAWLLLGAVAGLLLIACVNVANLMLARMAVRDREFAVRSALGAGRARLARLVLTEGLLLSAAGGGIGLLSATAMLRVFARLAPSSIPEIGQASLDLRVLAVTVVLAMTAGLAVGIWPAVSVLRSRALQYGARATAAAHPRLRFTLVTVQIALTVTLLAGSALLLRTLWNLVAVPLGYQSERVVIMNVTLNVAHYPPGASGPFFERLLERIREIPGTAGATMSSAAPPTGVALAGFNFPVDHQAPQQRASGGGNYEPATTLASPLRVREVTPGYFQTFGIPVLRGRVFAEADRTAQPTVILSESAAQILFPGQDPIGHTVQVPPADEWAEVVGVAREIRNTGLTEKPAPELYTLWRRNASSVTSFANMAFFAIRTHAGTADAVAFLKQAVADLDPQLPVTVRLLDDEVAALTERPRFLAWLLSAFAGLALLLAAAGLFGVASYLVTQRTRELGVRIALGAAPGDMARQVIGEAGRWIAAGAAGGALLSWGATRAIRSQLFQVAAVDPASWAAAFVVLGVALLAAVARPAVRAARVDPIVTLQAD
jgi:putative ABC transport system permease protein